MPPEIASTVSDKEAGAARFVRIELPRRGTLTLAEVQVFANGAYVAAAGVAKQSSTATAFPASGGVMPCSAAWWRRLKGG